MRGAQRCVAGHALVGNFKSFAMVIALLVATVWLTTVAKTSPKRNDAGDLSLVRYRRMSSKPPENEVEKTEGLHQRARKTHNKLRVDKQDTTLLCSVHRTHATLGNTSVASEGNSDNPAKKQKPQGWVLVLVTKSGSVERRNKQAMDQRLCVVSCRLFCCLFSRVPWIFAEGVCPDLFFAFPSSWWTWPVLKGNGAQTKNVHVEQSGRCLQVRAQTPRSILLKPKTDDVCRWFRIEGNNCRLELDPSRL